MSDEKKTILITGGNSGLGFECANNIASEFKEHTIVLACRDGKKAEAAVRNLVDATGNRNIFFMELDVASLPSVRNLVTRFNEQGLGPLDALLCNAGINGRHSGLTQDGFDVIFETNHLGHFLLVNSLLPSMRQNGRIVVVSSDMHCPPGANLVWPGVEELAHPGEAFRENFIRYSFSKLCNLYFTYEIARKLADAKSEITVNAFNPGLLTDTNFAPDKSRFTDAFMAQVADRTGSLEHSAKALADMMTSSRYEKITATYIDRGTECASSALSRDGKNARELWDMSVEYTRLAQSETLPGFPHAGQ